MNILDKFLMIGSRQVDIEKKVIDLSDNRGCLNKPTWHSLIAFRKDRIIYCDNLYPR